MESQVKGKLIIVSAPSGAGKTTLVKHLLEKIDALAFSVSATSRPKRECETDGKDYYFLSKEIFKSKIENNEFLEWEEVYAGVYYGTLLSEIDRITATGKHVVFDVDVVGGLNIKKYFGQRALSIFIQAPSIEVLAERLNKRAADSSDSIRKRIEKAKEEMAFADQFDIIFVNDDLNKARQDITVYVEKFIHN